MASNGIRVRGITIEIAADLSKLVKTFKNADSSIKRTQNNLKAISNYIKTDTSWTGLSNKIAALKTKQDLLKDAIITVRTKLKQEENALKDLGKVGTKQTNDITEKQLALKTQIALDTAELQKLEKEFKQFGSIGKQKAIAVGDALEATGTKITAVGNKIASVGRTLTMYLTTPIVGAGTKAVEFASDFDEAMSKVEAVSLGATTEELNQLREMAVELSMDSKYNATEAAEALYYMGLAGWDASEMMQALPDVLNLAAAGDMELGRASDIVTDYITAFGLTAADTTKFVDTMAKTMVNSNTDVDQLGDAFKYVAPVAGALGFSAEDVSFALGLMANNGIKASQAGTSLRQFMQRLAKPTAEVQMAMDKLGLTLENEDGTMKTFREIMDDLRESLGSPKMAASELATEIERITTAFENGEMTEEEYELAMSELAEEAYGVEGAEKAKNAAILAGTRGMSGLLAIVNTTATDYDTLSTAINGTEQSAKDIAATMLKNTKGAITKLKNSVYALGISFGTELTPYIEKAASWVKDITTKFSKMPAQQKKVVVKIAAITAAIGPLLLAGGKLLTFAGSSIKSIGSIVKAVAKHPIASAVALLATGIAALVVKLKSDQKQSKEAEKATWGLSDSQKDLVEKIDASKKSYEEQKKEREKTGKGILTETSRLETLAEELDSIVDENGKVKEGYEDRAKVLAEQLNEALGTEIELTDGIITDYQTLKTEIKDLIKLHKTEAALEAYKQDYIDALETSSEAYNTYADASKELATQQEKVAAAEKAIEDYVSSYPEMSKDALAAVLKEDKQYAQLAENLETAKTAEAELSKAVQDAHDIYSDGVTLIGNYDKAYEAFVSGNLSAADDAVNNLLTGFQTFDTSSEEQLKAQVEKYQKLYDQAKKDVENGVAGVSKATVDGYKNMVSKAKAELKLYNTAVTDSTKKAQSDAKEGAKGIAPAVKSGLGQSNLKSVGSSTMATYIDGISGSSTKATRAAKDVVKSARTGMGELSFSGPGSENIKSYIGSLNNEKSNQKVHRAGKDLAKAGRTGAGEVSYESSGESSASQMAKGMKTKTQTVKDQAKATALAAKAEADKVNWKTSGEDWVNGAIAGIKAKVALLTKQAELAAEDTKKAFDKPLLIKSPSRAMMESGENFVEGAAIGIERSAYMAQRAATDLAKDTAAAFSYNTASPSFGTGSSGSKTWNMGGIGINIYQQPGQDANELADYVMDRFYREVNQRLAVAGA